MRREGEENSDFQEGKENIIVSQTWALSQFTCYWITLLRITVFMVNFYLGLIYREGWESYHTYTCEMVPVLGYAIIFVFPYLEYSELVFLMLYFTCWGEVIHTQKSILQETIYWSKFETWKLTVRTTAISRCKYSFFGN